LPFPALHHSRDTNQLDFQHAAVNKENFDFLIYSTYCELSGKNKKGISIEDAIYNNDLWMLKLNK
jgi:uncharacterized protein YozE (UPF0346 family)